MANLPTRTTFETGTTLTISLASIGNGAGRISTQVNVNDSSLATAGKNVQRYRLKVITKSGAVAPTAGATYELYLIRSNGTTQNASFGTTDAAWTDATLRDQLEFIGSITLTATTAKTYDIDFYIYNPGPYIQIGYWNASGQTNDSTAGNHVLVFYPETDTLVA